MGDLRAAALTAVRPDAAARADAAAHADAHADAAASGGAALRAGPAVAFVLPGDIDDPTAPSGGNHYDRRLCQGLTGAGWSVRELAVAGSWPRPGTADEARLAGALAAVPDDGVVLLDGLVACAAPDAVVPEAQRLRLVVLVHLPLAAETGLPADQAAALDAGERRTLRAATAVIATSGWAREWLLDHHDLPPGRVHVAAPGVDPVPLAPGTEGGDQLLCVAAVTPRKGQDLLVRALATIADREWNCECVGALDRVPHYVERVRGLIAEHRLDARVRLVGPRTGAALDATYTTADLLVLPSRAEPYGMVLTEALARGIPVLATTVDGVPEAVGTTPDGRPGMLVPPGDPDALAGALREWLDDPDLRRRLRRSARQRRLDLHGWEVTSRTVAEVIQHLPR